MERMKLIGKLVCPGSKGIGKSRIGIGFEKLDRKAFEPEKAYDLVAQCGAHYIRLQSGWQRTETEKGKYDFSWLDDIVDNLCRRGMEPWIDLVYGNQLYTPLAREVYGAVGCRPIETEEERNAWAAYVRALVSRYSGKVTYYEIWNEPDGRHCWRPEVNAKEYAHFAMDTCRAIHEADANAKAISGVLCSVNLSYCKTMFEEGLGDYTDAISFHRYNANELEAVNEYNELRALIDRYNPKVEIIQGESGCPSSSTGAGALCRGAWTQLRQAKYLLRHRILDLSTAMTFTNHFTALDMVEALGGVVGDKKSYMDFGYFGIISADFDEDGLATGEYKPKLSYQAMQNLTTVFRGETVPAFLPVKRLVEASGRLFGSDDNSPRILMKGFRNGRGEALAYWHAAPLLTETYDGTISFQLAGEERKITLVNMLTGDICEVPQSMTEQKDGQTVKLVNLPITDVPYLLCFGDFLPPEAIAKR